MCPRDCVRNSSHVFVHESQVIYRKQGNKAIFKNVSAFVRVFEKKDLKKVYLEVYKILNIYS